MQTLILSEQLHKDFYGLYMVDVANDIHFRFDFVGGWEKERSYMTYVGQHVTVIGEINRVDRQDSSPEGWRNEVTVTVSRFSAMNPETGLYDEVKL